MTKAKQTTKTAAGGKKAAPAKPAKKAEAKAAPAKAAKPEKSGKPEKKTAPKAAPAAAGKASKAAAPKKPVKEKVSEPSPAASRPAVKSAPSAPAAEQPRPVATFSNSGLGVKISSARKPALSVAPGAMILGRPAPAKVEEVRRPSERRLSKKELQDIRGFLVEKRERLLAGMRRELAMQRERADTKAADEVDKATDAYDEDLSFEIAVANDQELEDIQTALEKIERGTYGECEVCGCGISPSRLKILPSATTCVSCRGQEEMSRRRDDGSHAFSMLAGEEAEPDAEVM